MSVSETGAEGKALPQMMGAIPQQMQGNAEGGYQNISYPYSYSYQEDDGSK
jgi:hypothetical protein